MHVSLLVEGPLDEEVARRLLRDSPVEIGVVYGGRGAGYIKKRATGFNLASQGQPILCLVDFMDTRLDCPADVVTTWCPHRQPTMLFRVVVRELESWLLADHRGLARHLAVRRSSLPTDPETVEDPKACLVGIARQSRSRRVRSMMVPALGTSSPVGPGYPSLMASFIRERWDPLAAQQRSPSLAACVRAIRAAWGG